METLVIKIDEESKLSKIKDFLDSIQVSFTVKKKAEKPYDPEFVKMVLEASKSNQRRVLDEAYKKELFGEL